MAVPALTDEEITTVAAVAQREGWTDLAAPPEQHSPRSLTEEGAVARFIAAAHDRRPKGKPSPWRIRLGVVAVGLVVVGICWWISPERTAIALLAAGIISLVALRMKGRKGARRAPTPFR